MPFTEIQVTQAVHALAVSGGSPTGAQRLLDFPISADTLARWRDETHAQRYADSLTKVQRDIESDTIVNLRTLAKRATEIEAELLERAGQVQFERDVPSALRAVSDTRAKAVDKLMVLTGRSPESGEVGGDLRSLLDGMAAKGLISLNVSLTLDKEAAT